MKVLTPNERLLPANKKQFAELFRDSFMRKENIRNDLRVEHIFSKNESSVKYLIVSPYSIFFPS